MIRVVASTKEGIEEAGRSIASGGLVVFPTETVYGLGASAFDDSAVQEIFKAKGRPSDNPLIVHIADMEDLSRVVSSVPPWVETLMEKFWPGPISFVLPKQNAVSSLASAGLPTVAVRMPGNDIARALIRSAGVPVVAPSANISGRPSPTNAKAVLEDFPDQDFLLIDGGDCEVGIESTVLLCEEEQATILRPGTISKEMIEAHCEVSVIEGSKSAESPRSPGQKYTHYSPEAKVVLVTEFPEVQEENMWWCSLSNISGDVLNIDEHNLYEIFREADRKGIYEILILDTPALRARKGLFNRIEKASRE